MASYKTLCECGASVLVNVGDRIFDEQWQWFQSYSCNNCGKTIEMDSFDEMPPEIEVIIMEQEGGYGLFLKSTTERAKVEFLLKKIKRTDETKFSLFFERKSDEIMKGTYNEILIIEQYLKEKGVGVYIIKLF